MAKYVLTKYLELFEHNAYDFKYHFAPNGVIDWYGRTIRGATNIHDYLRRDVYPCFEHRNFFEPIFCDPIETKTSHLRTKIYTNKIIDHVHPINRLPDKVPLKTYVDSDVEDDYHRADLASALLQKIQQPATPDKSYIEDLTPPASTHKGDVTRTLILDQGIERDSNMHTQQLKRSHDESNDNTKHLPKQGKHISLHYGCRSLLDDSSSSSDDDDLHLEAMYSPLQYIEVKGLLRAKSQPNDDAIPTRRQLSGRYFEERETCIRLSFRRRLSDNDIQFALIIYESLESVMPHINLKRNLLEQFATAANSSDDESIKEHATTIDIPTDTSTLIQDEDNDASTMAFSQEQMRTPTRKKGTPPPTIQRKSRSSMRASIGHKRLNNSPSGPIPKRTVVRSLRL